jgi:class 3 adenylate cyclase/predicted ATPase
MTFYEIVGQVVALLQRQGRVSYRALQREFGLDDAFIEDLKEEIIDAQRLAVDENGRILVWVGDAGTTPARPATPATRTPRPTAPPSPEPERDPLSYTPPHLAEKILTSRSALEGERKQVTVLFCDLANSTAIAERIGPENMHTLLNRFFELALEEVHRYEGTINQFLGDGFMALFGTPISHEDHARRGVLSALGLQRRLHEVQLGTSDDVACAFRMGLNSGLVVVASIGDNLRMDYTAVGDTTNLASRLQQHAEPGDIVVSESTSRLVQGYVRLEALQPVAVKGKTEPVPIYTVRGALPKRSPIVSHSERTLSQFVGRERELADLEALFDQVEAGQGQVVGIVAEAGGGKSRLLYEFRQRLQDKRVTYLEGRCLSYGSTIPYHPIVDLLCANCAITETDRPDAVSEKVRVALREVGMDAEESTPYLLQLLGVQGETASLAHLTPEAIRTRTFETLRQMSLKGSQQRPLIFEIEDLHWIDKTSEDYLASLVESLAGTAIMLLTTYRPGYRPPWIEKSYATQISLHSLAPQDGLAVVHSVLHGDTLPERLKQTIIEKAEGNPFFLEELTRAMIEQDGSATDIDIPDTVQGVLLARIDRLPEEPKRLLQTASVLGREFSPIVLKAIWEGTDKLEPLLLELKRLEFLFERSGTEEPIYVFKHALTQDVAYGSLLTNRRQLLHVAAGQALEQLYAARLEDAYDRLAYHYARTDNAAKAVEYLTRVAEKAVRGYAHAEAVAHLTQGLELLKTLPASPERVQNELDLQVALGSALIANKGLAAPEVAEVYTRARALCEHVEDAPQLFPVLHGLYRFHFNRAEHQAARELGEQLLLLAQRQQNPGLILAARVAQGASLVSLGEFPAAQNHLKQGIAFYDPQQHHMLVSLYATDTGVICRFFATWVLWVMGYPQQALKMGSDTLKLAQEFSHPLSLAFALSYASILHQYRRERQVVRECAEEAMTLCTKHGFPNFLGMATTLHGWSQEEPQRATEGVAQIYEGIATWRASGAGLWRPYFLSLLAEVYEQTGQPEEGLTVLAEALSVMNGTEERFYEAELYRLKGELLLLQSLENQTAVESCFHRALGVAQQQSAKSWELRAATSLATLWQRQGKRQDAYDLLAPVYGWFTEGFGTADLIDAKALLDELQA